MDEKRMARLFGLVLGPRPDAYTPGHRDRPVNRYPLSPKYVEIMYST
jgi:hypothetical protein